MKQKTGLLLGALVALTFSVGQAHAESDDDDYDQLDVSNNLSQLIRSNADQYWGYMLAKAGSSGVAPYLEYQGFVTGDPHMGNFAPLPVYDVNGTRQMRFLDVDFDDAGEGPLVLDFARFAITVKAMDDGVKMQELVTAYRSGLANVPVTMTESVSELMATPLVSYDQQATAFVQAHTQNGRLTLTAGKVEAYSGPIQAAGLASLFPGVKILDLAQHIQVRGGSMNEVRLWVLVQDASGQQRIMELKQRSEPGTSKYEAQPAIGTWWAYVKASFWPNLNTSAYDLAYIPQAGYFWKREKHKSLIDVPYTSDKKKKVQFVHDLAVFDANFLGLMHARQAQAGAFAAAISADPKAFHDATDALVDQYLSDAKAAFSAAQ